MLELKTHYQKRINKIKRLLISVTNKFDRKEIADELFANYMNELNSLDSSLSNIELDLQSLKYIINNILETNRNISEEIVEEIEENKLQNNVIEQFKPIMLMYYYMMSNKKNQQNQQNQQNQNSSGFSIDDLD